MWYVTTSVRLLQNHSKVMIINMIAFLLALSLTSSVEQTNTNLNGIVDCINGYEFLLIEVSGQYTYLVDTNRECPVRDHE